MHLGTWFTVIITCLKKLKKIRLSWVTIEHHSKIEMFSNHKSLRFWAWFSKNFSLKAFLVGADFQAKLHRKTSVVEAQACNFIQKETLAQVLPYKFCKISKKNFSYRTPRVGASIRCNQPFPIALAPIFVLSTKLFNW